MEDIIGSIVGFALVLNSPNGEKRYDCASIPALQYDLERTMRERIRQNEEALSDIRFLVVLWRQEDHGVIEIDLVPSVAHFKQDDPAFGRQCKCGTVVWKIGRPDNEPAVCENCKKV